MGKLVRKISIYNELNRLGELVKHLFLNRKKNLQHVFQDITHCYQTQPINNFYKRDRKVNLTI